MGEKKGLYRLVGKTMLDADFRGWVLKEPEKAAESIGVSLMPDQISVIREADLGKVEVLAEYFQELIGPSPERW